MRISDWSSDVCSSDLLDRIPQLDRVERWVVQRDKASARSQGADRGDEPGSVHQRAGRQGHPPGSVGADHRDRLVKAVGHRREQALRIELRFAHVGVAPDYAFRSEEHTSELQSLMRISYAVFCLKK